MTTARVRPAGRLLGVLAALAVLGGLAGCSASGGGGQSTAAAPVPSGENTAAPDLDGASLPSFVMPEIKGGVSMPNAKLTPGSVVNTNTQSVCDISQHGGHSIPWTTATKVFDSYGDPAVWQQHKLNLNLLVPFDLGGGSGTDNIWPASLRGTGFYQKVETDHVLRNLVCHRSLTLAAAQQDEETNWYAAWLRYVVATGNA
jgi:hypothetical protein